jgi:Phage protein (N4 Gp49/phage Sf6 gene 66) family
MANELYAKQHPDPLREGDDAAKAVQKTKNRISIDFIKSQIEHQEYLQSTTTPHMTILVMTMKNGFVVIGKSAPADPLNFDESLGKRFAYEDCVRQLWPLFAFSLRDQMTDVKYEWKNDG